MIHLATDQSSPEAPKVKTIEVQGRTLEFSYTEESDLFARIDIGWLLSLTGEIERLRKINSTRTVVSSQDHSSDAEHHDAHADPMDSEDRGIALNRVIWRLAEAMGLAPEGADKIDVQISEIVNTACTILSAARAASTTIVVEVKNEILGDSTFWRGPVTEIDRIRNIPARETARLVAKDGKARANGMWRVRAEKGPL